MKKLVTLILAFIAISFIYARSYYPKFVSVQGFRGSSDNIHINPWRSINSDGSDSILFSINTLGPMLSNNAIVRGDKAYLLSTTITTNFDYCNRLTIFDALTGETISDTTSWEMFDGTKSLKGIAYDAYEKSYYLLTYKYSNNYFDCSLSDTYLQKYDPKTQQCSYITTMQLLWATPLSLAYNPIDGELYLINHHGEIGILNKTTGIVEKVANLPTPSYTGNGIDYAMIYSLEDKAFIITYQVYTDLTNCEIGIIHFDPTTKTCKKITTSNNNYNVFYNWIANPDVYAVAKSPQKPIVYINYPQASTFGCIDIIVPSYAIDDTPLIGEVHLDVSIDSSITKLIGTPGEKLSVPMELTEGKHRLGINSYQIVNSDTTHGVGAHCLFLVGNDTPKAPTNVALNDSTIKWDNVSNIGINNGYIDTSQIKYNVYLNNIKLNEEPIIGNEYKFSITPTESQIIYQAHVEAVVNNIKSSKSSSNMIYIGECYSLPTYPNLLDFASSSIEGTIIIINSENDSYRWEWDNSERGYGYRCNIGYSWAGTTNDWIVLPKVRFDKPMSFYEINIFAFLSHEVGGKYEICFSPSINPDDIEFKKTITTKYDYHNRQEESIKILVPEAKDYYIMFHPVESALNYVFIQAVILDYAKNIVELEGEFAYKTKTTKLNWKNNLYTDPLITIKGYNIYRDGNLLAQVDNIVTSYDDKLSNEATNINHEYNVSIRYEYEGHDYETDLSNTFIATYEYDSVEDIEIHSLLIYSTANKIIIKDAPIGASASITSIDGKRIYTRIIESNTETLDIRKGVYLITINGNTSKVIVN